MIISFMLSVILCFIMWPFSCIVRSALSVNINGELCNMHSVIFFTFCISNSQIKCFLNLLFRFVAIQYWSHFDHSVTVYLVYLR